MGRRQDHPKYKEFRFDAGSLALNYVATVRHRGSEPRDLLATPEALSEWLVLAGVNRSPIHPSPEEYRNALLLREAIHDAANATALGIPPLFSDIERINRHAAHPNAAPQLSSGSIVWAAPRPVAAALADIARDAVFVIGGGETDRLRMCDEKGCRMLFFDSSPANRRRWCSMSICGNREKVALHRQRGQEDSTV
ncbi:MAG TPA: ABATE domain-containing protein [Syntrophorhabdaceae bacterium]|jgi:predicted RNA-binding Zn ribbon-like protein